MNVCESDLRRALEVFFREAHIPYPPNFSKRHDDIFVANKIAPAFLKALGEIEDVNLCHGFDIANVWNKEVYLKGPV
jgi:hypothetical protein